MNTIEASSTKAHVVAEIRIASIGLYTVLCGNWTFRWQDILLTGRHFADKTKTCR